MTATVSHLADHRSVNSAGLDEAYDLITMCRRRAENPGKPEEDAVVYDFAIQRLRILRQQARRDRRRNDYMEIANFAEHALILSMPVRQGIRRLFDNGFRVVRG